MSGVAPSLAQFPELARIVDLIASENPLQRKRIHAFLSKQEAGYWAFAEDLGRALSRTFLRDHEDRIRAARSYNRTCMDILGEQIRFRKGGKYLLGNASEAHEAVYSQEGVMRYYIVGLLLSYLFWPNHYEMFRFFREHLGGIRPERCLEVGAGHGLFTAEILRRFPKAQLTLVDISQTSIGLAREMLGTFEIDPLRVEFIHGDYLKTPLPASGYDFIVMGEVLEHVDDAPRFLERTRDLLRPDGTVFMSTCVNCPAVDHVYHFHNVGEIRRLIEGAGLRAERDLALAAEAVPEDRWEAELVTVNYCGILVRQAEG